MMFLKVWFEKIYSGRNWFCVIISHLSVMSTWTSRIPIQKAVLICCYLIVIPVKVYWAYAMSEVLCWISESHLYPLHFSLTEGNIYLHFLDLDRDWITENHIAFFFFFMYSWYIRSYPKISGKSNCYLLLGCVAQVCRWEGRLVCVLQCLGPPLGRFRQRAGESLLKKAPLFTPSVWQPGRLELPWTAI